MGHIHEEVASGHLAQHASEADILKPFLSGFDITWATSKRAYNSFSSVYFLRPEKFIQEAFGFDFEIMLVYSPYPKMEPRSIQSAEQFLLDSPAKGRVDSVNFFLVSDDENVNEWTKNYLASRQESRIIVTFSKSELKNSSADAWFVRNRLHEQFYGRDLFGYTLPLTEDTYFFGRQQSIASALDAVRVSENRGIFGLRKTGKTSLLLKIKRTIVQEHIGQVFFYDCKTPSLRKLHWNELLGEVIKNISERLKIHLKLDFTEVGIVKTFRVLIRTASERGIKVILIFDEIEYISFKSIQDTHWHKEYLDFWQTIWSCQSVHKNLVFIIAGVNPSVVEVDTVGGVQNPLFGIVPSEFLKGFDKSELKNLVKTLGRRMGIILQFEAIDYLYKQYGGHPLLSRLACSWLNKYCQLKKLGRPLDVSEALLKRTQEDRDSDLTFYCKHIVSELKQFYPDEYEMLELLSSGQILSFVELSMEPEFIKHLRSYGLVAHDRFNKPTIAIPVVARFIGIELARKEGRNTIYKLVESSRRAEWVEIRKESVLRDLRHLEKSIKISSKPSLFGINSFPEGEEFISIKEVSNKNEFQNFINVLNRCFVESIERFGESISEPKYFWIRIKEEYPVLFHALHRIKAYRHNSDHLELTTRVTEDLLNFLKEDLEGRSPSEVKDFYFLLQQRTIDNLLAAINAELNALN